MRPLLALSLGKWAPDSASTLAPRVDTVFWVLVWASTLLVAGLAVANLYFLLRYRRGSKAPRPPLRFSTNLIETVWIGMTTFAFLGIFAWGAHVYMDAARAPAGALEINVVGRQWMWDVRHANGRREFNELHVPAGEDVRLVLTSEDVIHSFFVPAFRLKQDAVPGRQVSMWFHPTRPGTYRLFCAEFCGTAHSRMVGDIIVMPAAEYAEWLEHGPANTDLAERGRRLFVRYNCFGCHDQPASVRSPPLNSLYGQLVPTSDGRMIRADERYLRDSILQPEKDLVAGYEPLMPSYQKVIPESDVLELIAYLKLLSESTPAPPQPSSP